MGINYSKHLKTRLELRKVDYHLPQQVFEKAEERFLDTVTGHTIAYNFEGGNVKLLTIHPLKEGQKDNRIKSGRWRKL